MKASKAQQQVILGFDEDLPQPAAALFITFKYNLKEGLSGFYRQACTKAYAGLRRLHIGPARGDTRARPAA